MRVLFVTQTPEFGGAERHLIDLVRRFDRSIECHILCFSGDFYTEALRDQPNVRVSRSPLVRERKLWSFWNVFRRHHADVIVLVKGIFDHYPLAAYLAARCSGAHRVVALEHLMPDPFPAQDAASGIRGAIKWLVGWRRRYGWMMKLQGRVAHLTVCVSEAIRNRLVSEYGYPPTRTVTIRNGIDLQSYSASCNLEESQLAVERSETNTQATLVCAARLSSVKRIDVLLEALALLQDTCDGWRCLILGGGPLERELKEQMVALGLSQRVQFLGHVADVRPYLRGADVFVLSSEKEGLPLALLEAMAAGVPAVVTDVGGTSEVVVHEQNGLLVRSGAVEELARSLHRLLRNADERRRMGLAAREHMLRHFDIDESMNRLKQVVLAPCA